MGTNLVDLILNEDHSFNENYQVAPWSDSLLDKYLQRLPANINSRLTKDATTKAVEYARTYRWYGHKKFRNLLQHLLERLEELEVLRQQLLVAKDKDKKRVRVELYDCLVDVCSISMLHIGGKRIGNKQIDVRGFILRNKASK